MHYGRAPRGARGLKHVLRPAAFLFAPKQRFLRYRPGGAEKPESRLWGMLS